MLYQTVNYLSSISICYSSVSFYLLIILIVFILWYSLSKNEYLFLTAKLVVKIFKLNVKIISV